MKTKLLYVLVFIVTSLSLTSQNLLNTNIWTVSSGSVSGFDQNGSTSENSREYRAGSEGTNVLLWKAALDVSGNADGGWNSSWCNTSSSNSYRFSIWIKKTNSNHGSTYFGFYANNSGSLRLNGTYNDNLYFFAGDLPKLNWWYLLVGYVHKTSHTGTTNTGGIYDGKTGEKVRTLTDYKLKSTVTSLRHRSYLYYDTNTLDRQYFYNPRIDSINGKVTIIEKKTNKRRILQVNHHITSALRIYEDSFDWSLIKKTGLIFISQKRGIFSVQQINRKLKDVFKKESKALNISSHSLRKSFGRQVYNTNGESEKALMYLSELFNHTSASVTRKYLGIRQEKLDDIYMNL